MADHSIASTAAGTPVPADDPARNPTVIGPDDAGARHVAVVGDTYMILVSGAQTKRALLPNRHARP